jgi:hypothetical protein
MEYLSDPGVSGPAPELVEVLLPDYSRYLSERRGLSLSTAQVYIRQVRPVVAARNGRDGSGLAGLCAADISRFGLMSEPGQAVASDKLLVTALRSYKDRHTEGHDLGDPGPFAPSCPGVRDSKGPT